MNNPSGSLSRAEMCIRHSNSSFVLHICMMTSWYITCSLHISHALYICDKFVAVQKTGNSGKAGTESSRKQSIHSIDRCDIEKLAHNIVMTNSHHGYGLFMVLQLAKICLADALCSDFISSFGRYCHASQRMCMNIRHHCKHIRSFLALVYSQKVKFRNEIV
jgi:hypothetical protein